MHMPIFLPELPPVSDLNITSDSLLLEINCLVHGKPHSHIFPVKIAGTETVGMLKKAIKDEKKPPFDHVPADTLVLWKVAFPVNESLDGNLTNFLDKESLLPVHGLSKVFSDMPKEEYLHIIVKGPSIEAIEPGEANDKLVVMFNSVYHIV